MNNTLCGRDGWKAIKSNVDNRKVVIIWNPKDKDNQLVMPYAGMGQKSFAGSIMVEMGFTIPFGWGY